MTTTESNNSSTSPSTNESTPKRNEYYTNTPQTEHFSKSIHHILQQLQNRLSSNHQNIQQFLGEKIIDGLWALHDLSREKLPKTELYAHLKKWKNTPSGQAVVNMIRQNKYIQSIRPYIRAHQADEMGILDFMHILTTVEEADERRALAKNPDLTYLFWESTLKCNLHCAHCGSNCTTKSTLRELTTQEICQILNSIADDFDARRIFVSITGGEPLLRGDLLHVVGQMSRHGMASCIVTNGTLLTEELAKQLVDSGMHTVSISVDGFKSEHNAIRGAGNYERALAGIEAARRGGMETVEVITCVRPSNINSLDSLHHDVTNAGATLHRFITIDQMGRGSEANHQKLWMDSENLEVFFHWLSDRRRELFENGNDPDTLRFSCGGFLGIPMEHKIRPQGGQCYAGLSVASILADGQVSACPSLPRSWAQGSALNRRFSDIWRNEFVQFRTFDWRRNDEPCRNCQFFNICLGGGLHERLVQPDSFCWIQRQLKQ